MIGVKGVIQSMWGIRGQQQYEKYLRFPSIFGRSKKRAFAEIKTNLWHKLQSWKGKLLSQGGKEILLKVVSLTVPTYTMSCFKLLMTFCKELEGLMANFWWGQTEGTRKIHWIGWRKMCKSKFLGSLGFKDLHSFNWALLVKQGWRILQNEGSLLHCIYKARYFPGSNFFDSILGPNPSYAWRGIWEARTWLFNSCQWRIGDRWSVKIWKDRWIPELTSPPKPPSALKPSSLLETLSTLIDPITQCWNLQAPYSLFTPFIATNILKIFLSPTLRPNKWIWVEKKWEI